jgi:hypothetical protein
MGGFDYGRLPPVTVENRFSTHSEPVWRERADFIIHAPMGEKGHFEQLWTRRVSDDTFEVCCIPFFLYDVALGDIVFTQEAFEKRYMLSRVVRPSGHHVFRVHFPRPDRLREEVAGELAEMGALLEWSSRSLLAVDALDLNHAHRIADFLQARENAGGILFETGRMR